MIRFIRSPMKLVLLVAALMSLAAPLAVDAAPHFDCADPKDPTFPCTDIPRPPTPTDTKEPPPIYVPTDTKEPGVTNTPEPSASSTPKPTVLGATATPTATSTPTVQLGSLVPPGLEITIGALSGRAAALHRRTACRHDPVPVSRRPGLRGVHPSQRPNPRRRLPETRRVRCWRQSTEVVPFSRAAGSDAQFSESAISLGNVPFAGPRA